MLNKSFCAVIVALLLIGVVPSSVYADEMSNTVPLSFVYAPGSFFKTLQYQASIPNPASHLLPNLTLTINISTNSTFEYTEDLFMYAHSQLANAVQGETTSVMVSASDALSILRLKSNTTISISALTESFSLPLQVTDLSYTLSDVIGSQQSVTMANTFLYNTNVPFLGDEPS